MIDMYAINWQELSLLLFWAAEPKQTEKNCQEYCMLEVNISDLTCLHSI